MRVLSRRSFLSSAFQATAVAASSRFFVLDAFAQSATAKYAEAFARLDAYIERYMREMNSPGMTLGLAGRDGTLRVASYGFSDLEAKEQVRPDQLFQIGSNTKSFAALVLLQLADEGKLDLHERVLKILPWLPIEEKWPITVHHLLIHSSGLPSNGPLFLSDPALRYQQGFEPGKAFYYCNLGFDVLGHVIEKVDGRSWPAAVKARIFEPLGMAATNAIIDNSVRMRTAKNYSPFLDDAPYPRNGRLAPAGNFIFGAASGSIASTSEDMTRYMHAIIRRGATPEPIASARGFERLATPYILAEEFGPKVHYGYGIAVDTLDGNKVLRHTGGMVSFMSAMQIDMDSGHGAFASINAQQGYRPNPVAQYALRLLRAADEGKTLPAAPEPNDPTLIHNQQDYVGRYEGLNVPPLTIERQGGKLLAQLRGSACELQEVSPDHFCVASADRVQSRERLDQFLLIFTRADSNDPHSPVVEASHGSAWFVNDRYSGPRSFAAPAEYAQYVGHYRNDDPWIGSTRVVLRKGKLWLDGVVPLEPDPSTPHLFHLRDEPFNPEIVRFLHIVDGHAQMMKLSGLEQWRVEAL